MVLASKTYCVSRINEDRALWTVIPHLKANGGSLIVVTSVEAKLFLPLNSAYAASKSAMNAIIETLRMELKHDNIPINLVEILPSTIDTPVYEKVSVLLNQK
jgi:NAD(P)-dependent dehydrogenase (short-subunit alcohol dehydrogenase family)